MSNSMKTTRVVLGIRQSVCIVLLLFTGGVLSAQKQQPAVKNIVLYTEPGQMVPAGKASTTFL